MNTIFKYNANAKYSTKDLQARNFSLLEVYLNKKGLYVKTQLPHIFKDLHTVAKPSPTAVGSD